MEIAKEPSLLFCSGDSLDTFATRAFDQLARRKEVQFDWATNCLDIRTQ